MFKLSKVGTVEKAWFCNIIGAAFCNTHSFPAFDILLSPFVYSGVFKSHGIFSVQELQCLLFKIFNIVWLRAVQN